MKLKLLALLLVVLPISYIIYYAAKPKPASTILIILDTLRADHLGFYGYGRNTSPVLDQFAKDNLAFTNAVSTSSWTPPSVATMITGLYPSSHTMMPPGERDLAKSKAFKLPDKAITLAEIFKENGYKTAALTPNPWITPEFGFDQGFDKFHTHIRQNAEFITREAKEMIEDLAKDGKPFFALVHYLDPHDPYRPPAPYSEMFTGKIPRDWDYNERMNSLMNQYDGEIRYMDYHLGDLFTWLKEKKLYDDTAILIIGDHGEQFLEHGDLTHGLQLYNEEINVPLFLKTAGTPLKGVIEEVVSNIDVLPTLVEQANIKFDRWLPGVSLTNLEGLQGRRGVMSEIDRKYHQRAFTDVNGLRVIFGTKQRETPLIGEYTDHEVSCFNSSNDPFALKQIKEREWCEELKELLVDKMKLAKSQQVSESQESFTMKDETLEQLRSLGYIQ